MKNLLFLLALSVLAGCHHIHEGEVVRKEYQHASYYSSVTYVGRGQYIPVTVYDDEDFILYVRGFDGEDTVIEAFYVSSEAFNCMPVGAHFNDSIPCERDDDGKGARQ